jgi:CubicO group peptidase (beta-lactamase class C family)
MVFAKGYGMGNLELDVPLSPNSVIRVASLAKQFTAASVALLALKGQLDLDAEIHVYLPEMPDFGAPITVRQLIHHTSGIRDHFELISLVGWTDRDYYNNARLYRLLTQQKELNFPPGTRHLYSNSNYVLLAEIIERVTGQSLREFADSSIFGPLGMEHTQFDDDSREVVKNRVTGYQRRQGGGYERVVRSRDGYGDVGLLTTIRDLSFWDANFYHPQVGGAELLDLIRTPGVLANGDTLDYAFGLTLGSYRGLATEIITGSLGAFSSVQARVPTEQLTVGILCNIGNGTAGGLAPQVAEIYLASVLEPEPESLLERQTASIIDLPAADLQRFVGYYWDADNRVDRRIAMKEGVLVLGQMEAKLAPIDEHTFVVQDVPVYVELVFADNAQQLTMTQGGGTPSVMGRYEPAWPTEEQLDEYVGTYTSDEGLADLLVTREGESLMLHVLHREPEPLRPLMADRFSSTWLTISFDRSGSRLKGLTIDGGRILGVRFTKRD